MSIEKYDYWLDNPLEGIKTGDKEVIMKIVCKYCGDERGTITLKYKSDKDQGLFKAKCICETCVKYERDSQ